MKTLSRATQLSALRAAPHVDLLVIGGGATGLGVALDAAARGLKVALLEAEDFAKGTSSRSTKLVHGGVRYLAQGQLSLVREALAERATLLANAPHLASALPFVMPSRNLCDQAFYGSGLKIYDALAGSRSLGRTEWLSAAEVRQALPGLAARRARLGVRYWDAQFDDARLAVALARTAVARGARVLNHMPVRALRHETTPAGLRVTGVEAEDRETGERLRVSAACVVNATGVWVDTVRSMDAQAAGRPEPRAMVTPSQGVHLVVSADFLGGRHALLVPKTADGRVLFAVPWMGHTVLGTTDTPRQGTPLEPEPLAEEVAFILREAAQVLERAPRPSDVRSVWVGLRPLVSPPDAQAATRSISREHTVQIDPTGLVTVTGGKWTTYRAMAEDVLAQCAQAGLLPATRAGITERLALVGAPESVPPRREVLSQGDVSPHRNLLPHERAHAPTYDTEARSAATVGDAPGLHLYGTEAQAVAALPGADRWLWRCEQATAAGSSHEPRGLSEAMVRFAARCEMARTVEDVLARRSRLLFLDAAQARAVAPRVAALLEEETGRGPEATGLAAFDALAASYTRLPGFSAC